MTAYLDLAPIAGVQGQVALPGSKSISNRVLLLAALSQGTTHIKGLLHSDDVRYMQQALVSLGIVCETLTVEGKDHLNASLLAVTGGAGHFPNKQVDLFLGNAGTAFRPLTAALALVDGDYRLSGVARMHERPIADLVDALRQLGGHIDYLSQAGYPPLQIHPHQPVSSLAPITVRGNVSSQFLTAILMAAPLLPVAVDIVVVGELISKPYIDITLNLMQRFGVKVVCEHHGQSFHIAADSCYQSPGLIHVEGDASSASYFLAAGAIAGPLTVTGIGRDSIQGDVRFAQSLMQMGAQINYGHDFIYAAPPKQGRLRAIDADCNHIPDAAMTLAMLALFADGTSCLRNIASWRVKETDRLSAMSAELVKLGAHVEEGQDFIRITPPTQWISGAHIDTYDDHRMAMCFSLATLGGVALRIMDPDCVAKTFPDYFKVFATIGKPNP